MGEIRIFFLKRILYLTLRFSGFYGTSVKQFFEPENQKLTKLQEMQCSC